MIRILTDSATDFTQEELKSAERVLLALDALL